MEAAKQNQTYDVKNILEILNTTVAKAIKDGKANAREAHEEFIAKALVGGAGMAHKLANVDSELPPLRLVFKKEKEGTTHFITAPIEVAMLHSEPWANTWNAYHADFDELIVPCFRKLRKESLAEAGETAKSIDRRSKAVRDSISKFSNTTAI